MAGNYMKIELISNDIIAETSSKGNQEKWFNKDSNKWYKIDQFGYEALSEVMTSTLLNMSNLKLDTPFSFVTYDIGKFNVHNKELTGCFSNNFLQEGYSIITLSTLYKKMLKTPLSALLSRLSSDIKRIEYLAETTAELTGLTMFPQYLTLLFEVDSMVLNDDRHLNNIAVLEHDGKYDYCPVFDNGAGFMSNVMLSPMDINPKALIKDLKARPFNTTFNRQVNAAHKLYGPQLSMPRLSNTAIADMVEPLLEYYLERDRSYIKERVLATLRR